jgi:DNA polymerase-3 subunit beta
MLSFTLNKQALKDLQSVKVGLSKDRYLVTRHYYCKVGMGYLRVYTFNNDYYLTRLVKIDNASNNTSEKEFLAPADFFDFKSDCQYNIDIDNQTALITSNNIKSTKQVFKDVSGFPLFTNDSMDLIAVINANDLLQLLKVKNAVYKDKYENYEVFKGVLFDIKDNVFNAVATNRSQLYWYYLNGVESNYLKNFYSIINEKSINALIKIIGKYNGDIYINSNNEYISFAFNNDKVKLITKLVEGNFPQYQAVLLENGSNVNSIILNKTQLINAISGLITKEIIAINVKFTSDKMMLYTDNAEANINYQNNTNNDITSYNLAINGKYTLDFLKTLPDNINDITFYFKEPIKPLEIRANNFILVMTPIRQ